MTVNQPTTITTRIDKLTREAELVIERMHLAPVSTPKLYLAPPTTANWFNYY